MATSSAPARGSRSETELGARSPDHAPPWTPARALRLPDCGHPTRSRARASASPLVPGRPVGYTRPVTTGAGPFFDAMAESYDDLEPFYAQAEQMYQ